MEDEGLRRLVRDSGREKVGDVDSEALGLIDTVPVGDPTKNVRDTEGVDDTDGLRDKVTDEDLQVVGVLLGVREGGPEMVGESEPLKEERDVSDPKALKVTVTVKEKQVVVVPDTVEVRLGEREALEDRDAEGQCVPSPLLELHWVGVNVPEAQEEALDVSHTVVL